MAVFDLTATMDGIASLITASALVSQVYAFPVDSITVPCALVGYPPRIDFDMTMARGSDQVVIPVWFVVGKTMTKDARDRLSTILADSSSIKSTLDGKQSFGDVRVMDAEITDITSGAVTYLAAKFNVEVYA